jgi:hypothetical protein
MRVLTQSELARMTRLELLAVLRQAANELLTTPQRSPERENALANLRKVSRALEARAYMI